MLIFFYNDQKINCFASFLYDDIEIKSVIGQIVKKIEGGIIVTTSSGCIALKDLYLNDTQVGDDFFKIGSKLNYRMHDELNALKNKIKVMEKEINDLKNRDI